MTSVPSELLKTLLYCLGDGRVVLRDEVTGTLEVHGASEATPSEQAAPGRGGWGRALFHAMQASVLVPQPTGWLRRLVSLVLPVPSIAKQGRFLDIGCGAGGVLGALGSGWERVGVEPNAALAALASRQPGIMIINGAFEDVQIPGVFECIRACHVIEHTAHTGAFLDAIETHLTPDGRAVIYTPNADGLARRLFGAWWACFGDTTHVRLLSLDGLVRECEAHGLTVVERRTYEMGIFADSLLRWLGGHPSARWFLLAQAAITTALAPLLWLACRFEYGDACYVALARARTIEVSPSATRAEAVVTETISPA
ncbi:MAG: class I SAM-dependent methyltransferase [Chloroflexi bacterium]|nr:MAG: class I SAM-dependent methyltransferase [Chloroflexota bacterium]